MIGDLDDIGQQIILFSNPANKGNNQNFIQSSFHASKLTRGHLLAIDWNAKYRKSIMQIPNQFVKYQESGPRLTKSGQISVVYEH